MCQLSYGDCDKSFKVCIIITAHISVNGGIEYETNLYHIIISGYRNMTTREKIKAVLNSQDSAYQIQQMTGVNSSVIIRLRNHTRSIDHLTLNTVEKLEKYFDYHVKYNQSQTPASVELSYFRHRLINLLQELYEIQQAKAESDDARPDERAMTAAIEQLFNDVITDKLELEQLERIYQNAVGHIEKPTLNWS